MRLRSTITAPTGEKFPLEYEDITSEAELGGRVVCGVHAYCFFEGKIVIVYSDKKGYWTPPGGGVEKNESIFDAVEREVKEETNMRVLKQILIGYQDIHLPDRVETQTRSCCLVEPHGPFHSDPDGDITKIKLIEPWEYKKYFDWGEVGDHIMCRALELKNREGFK